MPCRWATERRCNYDRKHPSNLRFYWMAYSLPDADTEGSHWPTQVAAPEQASTNRFPKIVTCTATHVVPPPAVASPVIRPRRPKLPSEKSTSSDGCVRGCSMFSPHTEADAGNSAVMMASCGSLLVRRRQKSIWASKLDRSYTADFEVYKKESFDADEMEMHILIALKK